MLEKIVDEKNWGKKKGQNELWGTNNEGYKVQILFRRGKDLLIYKREKCRETLPTNSKTKEHTLNGDGKTLIT